MTQDFPDLNRAVAVYSKHQCALSAADPMPVPGYCAECRAGLHCVKVGKAAMAGNSHFFVDSYTHLIV